MMWDPISRERKDALDTHSRLPVRNRDARERVVCRHEPLGSVAPLASLTSTVGHHQPRTADIERSGPVSASDQQWQEWNQAIDGRLSICRGC
jgi:hypothetical protein